MRPLPCLVAVLTVPWSQFMPEVAAGSWGEAQTQPGPEASDPPKDPAGSFAFVRSRSGETHNAFSGSVGEMMSAFPSPFPLHSLFLFQSAQTHPRKACFAKEGPSPPLAPHYDAGGLIRRLSSARPPLFTLPKAATRLGAPPPTLNPHFSTQGQALLQLLHAVQEQ